MSKLSSKRRLAVAAVLLPLLAAGGSATAQVHGWQRSGMAWHYGYHDPWLWQSRPVRRLPPHWWGKPPSFWDRHIEWCFERHRSYDPTTNTYGTGGAKRRVCSSPYA